MPGSYFVFGDPSRQYPSVWLSAGQTIVDDFADVDTDGSGNGSTLYAWSDAKVPSDGTSITEPPYGLNLDFTLDATTTEITATADGLWAVYAELVYRNTFPATAWLQAAVSKGTGGTLDSNDHTFGSPTYVTAAVAAATSSTAVATTAGFVELYAAETLEMTGLVYGGAATNTYPLRANLYLGFLRSL